MIFNNNFDKSLWLILASDKHRRMEIANFLNLIPKDVLDKISYHLKSDMAEDTTIKFNNATRDLLENTYLYKIEMSKKKLTIKYSKWGQSIDETEENFELSLVSLSEDLIKEVGFSDSIYLGGCYSNNVSLFLNALFVKCDGYFYYAYFDDVKQKVVVEILGNKVKEKSIDLNMIPDDINLCDLEDKKSINRLVRIKRRR